MAQTPREIVSRALKFQTPERLPRDLWVLPWAETRHPEAVAELRERFPPDIQTAEFCYPPSPRLEGDKYAVGSYTDEWGCVFRNIHGGIIGEIETPVIPELADRKRVRPPWELLPEDPHGPREAISRAYAQTDRFVLANCCPRPWERYQFLRGSQNALMDVMLPESGVRDLLRSIHEFYLAELEFWVETEVDAVKFMDDWGAQGQLLIPPAIWRELFKPLYRDYCDLARTHGKFVFMHTDGHVAEIYDDLIEVGVTAINSQLFCMDMADIARRARGRVTFWGEIDRQHVLTSRDPEVGRKAVREVASQLYDPAGGVIAQFELGLDAHPPTAIAIFEEWERWDTAARRAASL